MTTGPGGDAPTLVSSPGSNSTGSRRRVGAILGAVVVAAIVTVGALYAIGAFSTANHGSSYPTAASSFGTWRGLAQTTADGSQPGGWFLVKADAAVFATSLGVDPASLLVGYHTPGCTVTSGVGLPTDLPIAGLSNISPGMSYDWLYWFSNANGSAGLAVLVVSGTATIIGTLAGTQCATSLGQTGAVEPGVIDSPEAASAIGASGEYAYLTNHPVSNGVLAVVGNGSLPGEAPGPAWTFDVVDCSPINGNGTVASGPGYTATVGGVSGGSLVSEARTTGCYLPL